MWAELLKLLDMLGLWTCLDILSPKKIEQSWPSKCYTQKRACTLPLTRVCKLVKHGLSPELQLVIVCNLNQLRTYVMDLHQDVILMDRSHVPAVTLF